MIGRTFSAAALALALALLAPGASQAQLFRAYLASSGDDGNGCTLPSPCRLLPRALSVVADGGEVWMLDSANYNSGPVAIAKSVTVLAVPGALGSLVATAGPAVSIATPGVEVALRNLVIVGMPGGSGTGGVEMTVTGQLVVDQCVIANLPGTGITVLSTAGVQITDSTIRDNGVSGVRLQEGARAIIARSTISGHVYSGVIVHGFVAGTTTTADIAGSTISRNSDGVVASSATATATTRVSVRDSRVVQNASSGLSASSSAGALVTLSASNNLVTNNTNGINAGAGGTIWASGNLVSDNVAVGFQRTGTFESAGDNALRNNAIDAFGAIAVIPVK